ncbi:MAG TPA: hypothetical protein VHG91_01645, partial [Longimicrobium sp.]|nr:hypothetical protein [Longimicrobium sp.]
MPPIPRPTGFAILAGLLAVHTAISFVSFLWEGPDWTHPVSLVSRLVGGAGLVLAGVGAAALWRVEPWAHRAVGGWAMACAAQGFVNGAANTGTVGGGFLFSIASTVVPFLAFLYAEKRT